MLPVCGKRIPDSEHAVSMSLPTMQDVIGYEEKEPNLLRSICSGYPRFVRHWYILKLQEHLREQYNLSGQVAVLHSRDACEQCMSFIGRELELLPELPFGAMQVPDDPDLQRHVLEFMQHTGLILSSRQAEDALISAGLVPQPQAEETFPDERPGEAIRDRIAGLYRVKREQTMLYPSGMNAYFNTFRTLQTLQEKNGKDCWIQVGWLYLDTTEILNKFSRDHVHFRTSETNTIVAHIHEHHDRLAAVTTEIMTNPLLRTPDLIRISEAARQYDLPLIVDTSMPTPVNVDVFPYADVVVESLTKFAGGHADVMSGAVVFNPASAWGQRLQAAMHPVEIYERDLRRMAHCVEGYEPRMRQINQNTLQMVDWFREQSFVKQLHWAGQEGSGELYDSIRRTDGGYSGVITVVFDRPLQQVYDRLELLKGPSFGTEFTLCMAYMYMAHYNLVTSADGRALLAENGIDPELMRISIGLEPPEQLQAAFSAACR